jgi:methyl-accepting chemotaxis protein
MNISYPITLKYKRQKSCSPEGINSFIKEIMNNLDKINTTNFRHNFLKRLQLCINDRLYEQQKIMSNDRFTIDHLNIIKIYYDFFVKIRDYFSEISMILKMGEGKIIKIKNVGNFNHAVFIEFDDGDLLPFTDIYQDTTYLINLDFSKNIIVPHNKKILDTNTIDWSQNDKIKEYTNALKKVYKSYKKEEEKDIEDTLQEIQNKLIFQFNKTSRKTSRKTRKTSRKTRKTSRKTRKTSRKTRKTSRKTRKTSRKTRKTSRKTRKISRKTRKISRKTRKISRKTRKTSRKTRKTSRKTRI